MGGWTSAMIADAQRKQAERIIQILVEEIERKDAVILRLQAERDTIRYELSKSQNRTWSKTAVQGSNRTDARASDDPMRNIPHPLD